MIRLFLISCLLLAVGPMFGQWYAIADFSSCPRKYFPNTSGKDGPFTSESQCNSFINQARQSNNAVCAKYSCVNEGSNSSQPAYTPSGPSYQEIESEKKRVAAEEQAREKKRKEEEAAENLRIENEKALKRMKGSSSSQLGLKDTISRGTLKGSGSDAFGIKSVKETGIQNKVADKETRSIETAWKQLYCAKDILQYMTSHLEKIGTGTFVTNDLDEIKYLSIEVDNALNGTPMGVQCDTKNIPPAPGDKLKIEKKQETVSKDSKRTVAIGEKYLKFDNQVKSLQKEYEELDKKEKELKQKMINLQQDKEESKKLSDEFTKATAEKAKTQADLNMAIHNKKEEVKEYNSFHVTIEDPEDEQPAKKPTVKKNPADKK
jgi:hypothetical protein